MVGKSTFYKLNQYTNNFAKIEDIDSNLVYSKRDNCKQLWLTILIITYKRPDVLKDAIRSILGQKSVAYLWEVVVMDNNPESTVPDWFDGMVSNLNVRYYINAQNLGHEGNINRGIQLAKGEWVALLHDDDLLVPNYLQLIPAYIKAARKWKRPLAYIRANYEEFYGNVQEIFFSKQQIAENTLFWRKSGWLGPLINGIGPTSINSCGSLVNKQYFINIGGYNETFNPIGDSTLGLIFMNNEYSIAETSVPLGYYRQGKNLSSNIETLYDFLRADYYLREFLYQRNTFFRIFGYCFRDAQFYLQLQDRKSRAAYLGLDLIEEKVNLPVGGKKPFFRMKIVVLLQKIYLVLHRPNYIVVKWRKHNESGNLSRWIWNKN